MTDMSTNDLRSKEEKRLDEIQGAMEEQDMVEQQRLEEEEIDFYADDREEEEVDYPSTPEDENSSIPKFDPRTQEQKRDDAHQVQILESNLRVEAMIADLAENPTTIDFDFDFDFDAGYSYGHDQEWLLYSVFFFMQKYPEVRGVYFIDFCDELEANTGYEVDHKQLDNLLKHWVPLD